MSTIAVYKIFEEKDIDTYEVVPKKRASRRSMQTYSLDGVGDLPPTLVLSSLNHTFQTKHLELFDRVKIGRQVSQKTCPSQKNGYFNSKVLSRTHAEVWSEGGRVYIKDLKSSNGTYLNNHRLSPEGDESQPFEVKDGDVLEFGVNIDEIEKTEFQKVTCSISITLSSLEKLSYTPRLNQDDVNNLEENSTEPSPNLSLPNKLEEYQDRVKEHTLYLELEQTKAELKQFKDRCHSLENALNQSNKALQTVKSKTFTHDLEKASVENKKLQHIASIIEDHQVFGNGKNKQHLLYNKKFAGFLEMNRRENCELSRRALHGYPQDQSDCISERLVVHRSEILGVDGSQESSSQKERAKTLESSWSIPRSKQATIPKSGVDERIRVNDIFEATTRKPPTLTQCYRHSSLPWMQ